MKLKDKVVVVFGATGGIGKAIVKHFAAEGAKVYLCGRNLDILEHMHKTILRENKFSRIMTCDITSSENVNSVVADIVKDEETIDILINCFGTFLEKKSDQVSDYEWFSVLNVNLTGIFYTCRAVLPCMKEQKSGIIFNFSSIGGKIALENKAVYCASKFGVVGYSKSLAKEVKQFGIKVHLIYPYLVDSEECINWSASTEETTILKTDDVAECIVNLAKQPKRVYIEEVELKPYLY